MSVNQGKRIILGNTFISIETSCDMEMKKILFSFGFSFACKCIKLYCPAFSLLHVSCGAVITSKQGESFFLYATNLDKTTIQLQHKYNAKTTKIQYKYNANTNTIQW